MKPPHRGLLDEPGTPPGTPPEAQVRAPSDLAGIAALTQASRAAAGPRLRAAMGRFATGVTIVTTSTADGGVHGMTANGVMSVSLEPPLVMVSLKRGSRMDALLPATRRYGLSVLADDQEWVAMHFAGRPAEGRVPELSWWGELPFASGAIAHVGCTVWAVYEAGDHRLWLGRVEYMGTHGGAPLLFHAGRFGQLA